MGKFEELSLEGMSPQEQLVFTLRAQVALLEDIREELRYIKTVQLKQHIEMTHVCDSTRGIESSDDWVDTMTLQLPDVEVNRVIKGIELEQVALEAMEKNGQVAIGG